MITFALWIKLQYLGLHYEKAEFFAPLFCWHWVCSCESFVSDYTEYNVSVRSGQFQLIKGVSWTLKRVML